MVYHFTYADDNQIYLPLKRNQHVALESLFACLDEMKTCFSQKNVFLNEEKSKVIFFGPSENSGSRSIDLDYLAPFTSSCIKNLGVFWDQSLKFDKQINVVFSSCFFQPGLSKIKFYLCENFRDCYPCAHYILLGLLQLSLLWHF